MKNPRDVSTKREQLSELQREALSKRLRAKAQPLGPQTVTPRPEDRHLPFPLTDLQEAYWVGRRDGLALGNTGAHIYYEFDAPGLDPARLSAAWQRLIARHEMLRAVFLADGRQQILPDVPPYQVEIDDLREATPEERDRRLRAARDHMSHRCYTPDRWPLFEIRASLLPRGDVKLHVSFDVLLCDGQSLHVLLRELSTLCADPAAPLAPLDLSFRDYVLSVRSLSGAEARERSRSYWSRRARDLFDAPELPLRANPSAIERPRFVRREATLDAHLWDRLKARAARAELTPSGLLCAAFAEVLARWSRGARFTLNLTLFNRLPLHPQVNEVVGDFTSLVLLGVDMSGAASFEARARRLQEQLWSDLQHTEVSGLDVLREVASARGDGRSAAMPVVFTSLLHQVGQAFEGPLSSLPWTIAYGISQTPQVWLDHQVAEYDGKLRLHWDAVEELFPEGLLDEMFAAYEALLMRLARDEENWTGRRLDLLPEAQRARREALNRTEGAAVNATLGDLALSQVASRGDELAVVAADGAVSYRELRRRASRLAARLRGAGLGRGELVAVLLDKGSAQVEAVVAVHLAGGAYVPIEPGLPPDRVRRLLLGAGVRLAVVATTSAAPPQWPEQVARIGVHEEHAAALDAPIEDVSGHPVSASASGSDLAYVIYTSGSTGEPKGVMIAHQSAANTVVDINERFGVGPRDRVFALSSLSFDLSVYDIFGMLATGGAVVMPAPGEERDPARWAERMRDARVTVWNSVPALMEMLVEHLEGTQSSPPDGLRLVLLSGDWIPLHLPGRVRALWPDAEVISLGGATEASIWSIYHRIGEVDPSWSSIPYGRPLRNQRVYVLNEELEPCADEVTGEIYIGGAGVAEGYLGDEPKTRERFIHAARTGERLYRTGDLGRYRRDGSIELLGREDGQVKLQGYRVELGEVESALAQHPEVAAAVVIAAGQPRGLRQLIAYVVQRRGSAATVADLDAFLRRRLPVYMVPGSFAFLDEIPLTANGKVDRNALPGRAAATHMQPIRRPPTNDVERALAEIWSSVLDVEDVGLDDDFFRSGGTSVLAMRFCAQVHARLGSELPLRAFFASPVLGDIAQRFAGVLGTAAPLDPVRALPAIVPAPTERHEPFPLTDIQQAYWLGRSAGLELGGVAPHVYTELEGLGVDIDRVRRAWQRLIDRHDMLRAVFLPDGRQRVLSPAPDYTIPILDLRASDPAEMARALDAVRDEMSHRVPSPERWPLFDLRFSLLADGRVRLHISFDLLVGDAWSLVVLTRELTALYRDPEGELPPIDVSFRDYTLAEAAIQGTEVNARAIDYWRRRLLTDEPRSISVSADFEERADALPPPPELPTRVSPAAIERPRFTRRACILDTAIWERLEERSRTAGLTPSIVLCAAFAEVLARWSRSARFTLNLTLFNRLPLHPQVNDVVGDFTSLVLLGVDMSGAASFEVRARRMQEQLFRDLDHRAVSGVRVLRELARIRGSSAAGAMPIVFTSTLGVERAARAGFDSNLSFESLPLEPIYGISQTPQVWLDHQVAEYDGELRLHWDAVEELFPEGLLDEMFAAYEALLMRLARDEESWTGRRLDLLPEAQRARREALNRTEGAVVTATLADLALSQIAPRGDEPAVIAADGAVSYRELRRRASRLAARLRGAGLGRGELVAVLLDKGSAQVEAVVAVHLAGGAYVPIEPGFPPDRVRRLLLGAGVRLAVVAETSAAPPQWPEQVARIGVHEEHAAALDAPIEDVSGHPVSASASGSDLAYVIYTSGSTGEPKGVMIAHQSAANTVVDINERFGVGPRDRVFALSSLSFDLSVYDIFGMLAAGGAVVMPAPGEERDPARWAERMRDARVTVWSSVPALMEMLVEHLEGTQSSPPEGLRLVLLSGDWIPLHLPGRVRALWPEAEVISVGGATEASIWSIYHRIGEVDPSWSSIPYGRPLRNQRVYVLNEELEPCADEVTGEIYIGGAGVAEGYLGDEPRTRERFIHAARTGERLYRTGDLGRYQRDGSIELLGREDGQVKLQGYRVELGEVESALAQHPEVAAAVVVAAGQPRGPRQLVAYVVQRRASKRDVDPAVEPDLLGRLRFRLGRPGLRTDGHQPAVHLARPALTPDLVASYIARRSYRQFSREPISAEPFGHFLSCLMPLEIDGYPLLKYLYASAGGLYPVQAYLVIRGDRIAGLAGGAYYYSPVEHGLVQLASDAEVRSLSPAVSGDPVEAQAAFAIFLVGKLAAIAPSYGAHAVDFCKLEAGIVSHLLETTGPRHGIGLCQAGAIAFDALRPLFRLDAESIYLHGLLGGRIEPVQCERSGLLAESEELRQIVRAIGDAPRSDAPITAPPPALVAADLRRFLAERLPAYMIPSRVLPLDELPLTANGKVNRAALERIEARASGGVPGAEPTSALEREIAAIWGEVLGAESVGLDDGFFDLGGNSLLLVQIQAELRKRLGVDPSMATLFQSPTVRALAANLDTSAPEQGVSRGRRRAELRKGRRKGLSHDE